MSEFQKKLLDMPEEDLVMAIASAISELNDISQATGKTFCLTVSPDNTPILIADGKIDNDFTFEKREISIGGLPGFGDVLGQLDRLSIFG